MMPSGLPSCQDWNFINIKANSFLEVISFLKKLFHFSTSASTVSYGSYDMVRSTVRFGPKGTVRANGGT